MLEAFSEVRKDIKFLFSSEIRLRVLMALMDGPMELSQMRSIIKSSSSTILHAIYQLEEKGMVSRVNRKYELSSTGRIISLKVQGIIRTISVVRELSDFLLDHDLRSLPESLLYSIESLEGASLLEAKPENLTEPYEIVAENVLNSGRVWIVSGVQHPFYEDLLKSGIRTEMILSGDVADALELEKAGENVKISTIDSELRFSLIITDTAMALSLFMSNGLYDPARFLFSRDEEAIGWAWRLFRHFREMAEVPAEEECSAE
ncbi:MAG: winged helix-turn-helix domain-containing protein [Methanothermobacter sp.]|nr:winged helix-turn-helix domain-containing protein [Methanothermobacter sp.]